MMVKLPRTVRRLLIIVVTAVIIIFLCVGWHLVKIQAAAQHVIWQTMEGGLTLSYFPLKGQAFVFAGNDCVDASARTWVLTDPGGMNWFVGAPTVPSPEELFARARIGKLDTSLSEASKRDSRIGLISSTADGLVRLHVVASDKQKLYIVNMLKDACERQSYFCEALREIHAREP